MDQHHLGSARAGISTRTRCALSNPKSEVLPRSMGFQVFLENINKASVLIFRKWETRESGKHEKLRGGGNNRKTQKVTFSFEKHCIDHCTFHSCFVISWFRHTGTSGDTGLVELENHVVWPVWSCFQLIVSPSAGCTLFPHASELPH